MIKNIANGYQKLLSAAAKVLALAAVCLALGTGVVFPLWKWATASPGTYTAAMLALMALAAAWWLFRSMRRAGAAAFFLRLAKAAIVLGGAALCVALVLHGRRVAAALAIPAAFAAYGALAFGGRGK